MSIETLIRKANLEESKRDQRDRYIAALVITAALGFLGSLYIGQVSTTQKYDMATNAAQARVEDNSNSNRYNPSGSPDRSFNR